VFHVDEVFLTYELVTFGSEFLSRFGLQPFADMKQLVMEMLYRGELVGWVVFSCM